MGFDSEARKPLLDKISETLSGQWVKTPSDGEARISEVTEDRYNGIHVLRATLDFGPGYFDTEFVIRVDIID